MLGSGRKKKNTSQSKRCFIRTLPGVSFSRYKRFKLFYESPIIHRFFTTCLEVLILRYNGYAKRLYKEYTFALLVAAEVLRVHQHCRQLLRGAELMRVWDAAE